MRASDFAKSSVRLLIAVLAMPLVAAAAKKKATPPSTTFYPAGAQRGTTSTLTLSSKLEGEGKGIAIDCPGVFFAFKEKGQVAVTVTPDAPLGLHLVTVFNHDGAAEPRWFSIGTLPELMEVEPNDALIAAQRIEKLPVCLNGQLEKAGVADLFSVDLAKGQTLCAKLEAYELGSLVDPEIEVRDDQNTVVAMAHDSRDLDPTLVFTAARQGRYTIQVAGFAHPPAANVNFVGASGTVYRLLLSNAPATLRVFPAAVSRKEKTKLSLIGANISETADFDALGFPVEPLVQKIEPKNALSSIQVAVTEASVQREIEPNNEARTATLLTVPACVGGLIEKQDDEDRYLFEAKKGHYYNLRLLAKQLGLALEGKLRVLDATEKEVAANEDAGGGDPLISFKAPSDGRFQIVVSDLYNKGGSGAEYVLMLGPGEETFGASMSGKASLSIEPGKTVEIKAKLSRVNGYAGDLIARVAGLPIGVSCADVEAPKKSGSEFTLKLQAAANAAPFNGPISVVLWTKEEKDKPTLSRAALLDLRGDNRRGISPLDTTDRLWLTVLSGKTGT